MFGMRFGKRGKASTDGQVGLVVSDESVTAVHILRREGELPRLLARFDGPKDGGSGTLAAWVAEHRLQGVPAALTLDHGDYVIHQLDRPEVPAEELRQALRWRLKDLIDYSPADAVIDVFEAPPARQKRIEPVQAMPGELELDLELATGLRNFSRFVDRAGVLSSISGSDSTEDDDEEASAPAPRTATFRLGG